MGESKQMAKCESSCSAVQLGGQNKTMDRYCQTVFVIFCCSRSLQKLDHHTGTDKATSIYNKQQIQSFLKGFYILKYSAESYLLVPFISPLSINDFLPPKGKLRQDRTQIL